VAGGKRSALQKVAPGIRETWQSYCGHATEKAVLNITTEASGLDGETTMPLKSHRLGLIARDGDATVPLLDEAPLGHLQALIAKKLQELGSDAFGYKVLEELSLETRVWIDHSRVYATIRSLLNGKYIKQVGTRDSPVGGPPVKIYELTAAGAAALNATVAHYQAMGERLTRQPRKRRD
jgi:DNA-binding PadR family transcriptional regulator